MDSNSDEDKNKHPLAPYEGIVKFRHTLLVHAHYISVIYIFISKHFYLQHNKSPVLLFFYSFYYLFTSFTIYYFHRI